MTRKTAKYSLAQLLVHSAAFLFLGGVQILGATKFEHVAGAAVGGLGVATGFLLLLTAAAQYTQGLQTKHQKPSGSCPPAVLPRWVSNSLGGFLVLMLLLVMVHVCSPDPKVVLFPEACPKTKLLGCARVAVHNAHRAAGKQALDLTTTLAGAEAALKKWLRQQPRTEILKRVGSSDKADPLAAGDVTRTDQVFFHARVVSLLWGFADDFFVHLTCLDNGKVRLEVQGQLRVGVGDMDVNVKRNAAVLDAMSAAKGKLPQGSCR